MATVDQQQVASSPVSPKNGRHNTTVTLQESVELINSALWYYRQAGGAIRMGNSPTHGMAALLVLPALQVCQKCWHVQLFEDMAKPDLCQKCAETQE